MKYGPCKGCHGLTSRTGEADSPHIRPAGFQYGRDQPPGGVNRIAPGGIIHVHELLAGLNGCQHRLGTGGPEVHPQDRRLIFPVSCCGNVRHHRHFVSKHRSRGQYRKPLCLDINKRFRIFGKIRRRIFHNVSSRDSCRTFCFKGEAVFRKHHVPADGSGKSVHKRVYARHPADKIYRPAGAVFRQESGRISCNGPEKPFK